MRERIEKQFNEDWNYVEVSDGKESVRYHRNSLSDMQFVENCLFATYTKIEREINPTIESDLQALEARWRSLGFNNEADEIHYEGSEGSFHTRLHQDVITVVPIRLENPVFYMQYSMSIFELSEIMADVKPVINSRLFGLTSSGVILEGVE